MDKKLHNKYLSWSQKYISIKSILILSIDPSILINKGTIS